MCPLESKLLTLLTFSGVQAEEYEMWAPQDVKRSEGIAYFNSTHRSSEILGESSAALAAASVIFESQDKEWSDKLRDHAIDLFERATKDKGTYMDSNHPNMRTAKEWYPSHGYNDELAWAAAWIYVATGDAQWKTTTDQYIKEAGSNIGEVCLLRLGEKNAADSCCAQYSWDEKLPGAVLLMYLQTGDEEYKTAVERYISVYRPSGSVKQTAKGLSFHYAWGSLRFVSLPAGIFPSCTHVTPQIRIQRWLHHDGLLQAPRIRPCRRRVAYPVRFAADQLRAR